MRSPIDNLAALSNAIRPGVVGWMKTLAREVGPKGITVNTIAPGRIDTERLRSIGGAGDVSQIPLGRLGEAAEIAAVACFLASDGAGYVTGAVVPVDGGLTRNLLLKRGGNQVSLASPLLRACESMNIRRHLSPLRLAGGGLFLLLLTAIVLWLIPSGDYIFLPDTARPVAPLVEVKGGKDRKGPGGIYYDAVIVRRAKLFERIFPWIHEGATLVPADQINPPGVSDSQRRREDLREMARSQDIAGAVALKYLGYNVIIRPIGALVSEVAPGSPAAKAGLQPTDVIVGADGKPVHTNADLEDSDRAAQTGPDGRADDSDERRPEEAAQRDDQALREPVDVDRDVERTPEAQQRHVREAAPCSAVSPRVFA